MKLIEYEHVGCDGPGCGDCELAGMENASCKFPCPGDNVIHLIPAAVADAADAVVQMAVKLDKCYDDLAADPAWEIDEDGETLAADLKAALAALEQVRDA